jgi:negative regulator of flagellin synthesis FlgM
MNQTLAILERERKKGMDMRIGSTLRSYEIYNTPTRTQGTRVSRAEEKQDSVALSSHAKDYRTARRALDSIPDIREDKVNAVKTQIDNGTYNVSAKDVVEKMFMNLTR